jgi:RecJ-like exonuclease
MNRIDFTIDTPKELTVAETAKLQQMAREEGTTINTLDAVEYIMKFAFPATLGYFVYRGGSHVALIRNNKRIAMAAERPVRRSRR